MVIDKLRMQPSPGPLSVTLKMKAVFSTESPNKRNKHKVYSPRNNHLDLDVWYVFCFFYLFLVLLVPTTTTKTTTTTTTITTTTTTTTITKTTITITKTTTKTTKQHYTPVWTLLKKPLPLLAATHTLTYADACWCTTVHQFPNFAASSGTTPQTWVRYFLTIFASYYQQYTNCMIQQHFNRWLSWEWQRNRKPAFVGTSRERHFMFAHTMRNCVPVL